MALRDDIYEYLKTNGPKKDEELEQHFNMPRPSIRRSRQELVKKGLVQRMTVRRMDALWGVPKAEQPGASTGASATIVDEPN